MNEHTPSASVGEPASYMFGFRNPFGIPLDVDIDLGVGGKSGGFVDPAIVLEIDTAIA